jgi:hypothetical protein
MRLEEYNEEFDLRKAVFDHLQSLTSHYPSGVVPSAAINSFS